MSRVAETAVSKWRHINAQPSRPKAPSGIIPPLLPTLVSFIPEGDRWLHEIKWDGYRIGVYLDRGAVRVFTRNLYDWTERFPSITRDVGQLQAREAVIDGEAVVVDENGLTSFSDLQAALGTGGNRENISFVAFDLLRLDGEDLRKRPLIERREALLGLLDDGVPDGIIFSETVEGSAEQIFSHSCRSGLEGIVSKLRDSPYISGRRREWVKTKCVQATSSSRLAMSQERDLAVFGM